jgi:hypothetical protein
MKRSAERFFSEDQVFQNWWADGAELSPRAELRPLEYALVRILVELSLSRHTTS